MARAIRQITGEIRVFEERPPDPNNYLVDGTKHRMLIDTCSTLNGNPYAGNPAFARLDSIVLTHPHFDHVAGIDYLPGVPVMAHQDAAAAVNSGDACVQLLHLTGVEAPQRKVGRGLIDGEILDLGGVSLQVVYTPGHCIGSICLYEEESKALISGDTVFTGGALPRSDFPTSNPGELLDSYEKLLALEVNLILPGHGAVSSNGSAVIQNALKLLEKSV
ncbi:MAG: MBL fold metallo-hydrolase [Candidatus Micrarchaeota archaeon]